MTLNKSDIKISVNNALLTLMSNLITSILSVNSSTVTCMCKETLSILTYAKSTITYNLKKVPLVLFITSKKLEKTNI